MSISPVKGSAFISYTDSRPPKKLWVEKHTRSFLSRYWSARPRMISQAGAVRTGTYTKGARAVYRTNLGRRRLWVG